MPVYEFTCQDCHKNFEVVRHIADAAIQPACPGCGSTNVERAFSSVFAVTSKKS
jgi:putative FmdB family regulatory protein